MVWLLIALVLVTLWLVALVDVIGASDMDDPGRVILGLLLIFVAPVGVILWTVLRGGRAGQIAAAAVIAIGIAFAVSMATVNHAPVHSVELTQTFR
jgi:hypothetical protein